MKKGTLIWVILGCALLVFGFTECDMGASSTSALDRPCDAGADATCPPAHARSGADRRLVRPPATWTDSSFDQSRHVRCRRELGRRGHEDALARVLSIPLLRPG